MTCASYLVAEKAQSKMISKYFKLQDRISARLKYGSLVGNIGYFRFTDKCLCYGRNSLGAVAKSTCGKVPDISSETFCESGVRIIPFDLSEVTNNFLKEAYATECNVVQKQITRVLYYLLRPILPVSVRKHLQRCALKGWDEIDFPNWPVDTTVDCLMKQVFKLIINGSEEIPFIWFWPDGRKSCLIITHDVETSSGRDFCETLMDIDESYGFKSAFQIVPEQRYEVTQSFLDKILRRGFEVNIHGLNHDGRLFSSWEAFSTRIKKINDYGREFGARGFRSPVLYRNAEWIPKLDFDYDMSFPNVGHLDPQRGGCCTVMPYFIDNMVELPLTTIQDYSLLNICGSFSIDIWKEQVAIINSNNGLISFNIHPDYIRDTKAMDTYTSLLAYLRDFVAANDVWCALPGEVANWWRNRDNMKVTSAGKINGPDSMSLEQSVLAHSYLEEDQYAYRISDR